MNKEKKKIGYILLGGFLLFETAVVFLQWPPMAGLFCYLFILVIFFSKKALEWLFPISIILAVLSVFGMTFSQNDLANLFSFWLFLVFVLITWALIVRGLRGQGNN